MQPTSPPSGASRQHLRGRPHRVRTDADSGQIGDDVRRRGIEAYNLGLIPRLGGFGERRSMVSAVDERSGAL